MAAARTCPEHPGGISLRVGALWMGARRSRRRRKGAAMSQVNPNPGILALHPDQEVAVLLRLAAPRRRAVQRLQPPLPPAALSGSVRGVLAAPRGRHPVGRRRAPSGRSRSPARTRSSSPTCSRRATCPGARSGSASTPSSLRRRAGSSTTLSCCGWARTTSGSRWPTATCCCGPRGWRTTRGSTCRSPSRTWVRCRSRGRSPRR